MRANTIYCSFCRKSSEEVEKLVADPTGKVHICDECIKLCSKIVKRGAYSRKMNPSKPFEPAFKPKLGAHATK